MSENSQEHFYRLLKDFRTAMLVTHTLEGELHSFPMAIGEAEPDGNVWFVTAIESTKVDEIRAEPRVNVSLQDGDKFLSITGRAEIVQDRAKIEELWSEFWKVWFPDGKDDPDIALIRVEATQGEFWDNAGTNKLKFLFDAAKAYVQGTDQEYDPAQNQKVDL